MLFYVVYLVPPDITLTQSKSLKKFTYQYINNQFKNYFKDARSVSLYPYNRSQILQCVKYT